MDKTLIINYSNMRSGGVETMLAYLIKYALEHKMRVIWITSTYLYPLSSFKDIVDYSKVESIILKAWEIDLLYRPKMNLKKDENVVMFSTTPLRYIGFEKYRKKMDVKSFQHFLCLPNFKGEEYFPDQYFKNAKIRSLVYKYFSSVIQKIEDNDGLRAFNEKHLDTYEDYYNLEIKNKKEKKLGGIRPDVFTTESELYQKAESRGSELKIVTCSRFDFPHKGYLIGLLKAYSELYSQFPHMSLTIIGYGDGLSRMKDLISTFSSEISESIHFTGMLSHDETLIQIKKAHLFVGLAGAAGDAARCSTATVIVRHFSYSCEAYGFYHDASDHVLSCDEGEDVKKYISDIINMTDEEYVKNCMMTKQINRERRNYNPAYLFNQGKQELCLSNREIRLSYVINTMCWIKKTALRLSGKLGIVHKLEE